MEAFRAVLGPTTPLSVNETVVENDVYYEAMENGKTFLDSIHNQIAVHPLLVSIIDTLQFQRLRDIKMLGTAYLVFPGGTHTRFEHCIGVAYLAGKFVSSLRHRQPELNITKQDVLAVMVAGLCHDLGHGPFSHTFERFMHAVDPETTWTHEQASIQMFRFLIESNSLVPTFRKYGMEDIDIMFVEEVILGERHVARGPEKAFLYEIVANKRNGCDVDRWDYFLRDAYHTNIKCAFENYRRFIDNARAVNVNGEWQICFRDKLVSNIRGLFELRCELHRKLYQHKTNKLVEQMVIDALVAANDHLLFPSDDGKMWKMSQAVRNMSAYMRLDDSILSIIRNSIQPELSTSRDILTRIYKRDFYAYVMRTAPAADLHVKLSDLQMDLATAATQEVGRDVPVNDISVMQTVFDYGMKDRNPFERVCFYGKDDKQHAKPLPVKEMSKMLPNCWLEKSLYVYYKKKDPEVVDALKQALLRWAGRSGLYCKSRMDSVDELERPVGLDGLPDTVAPDLDISALKEILFSLYKQPPPPMPEPGPLDDILKRLDEYELSKTKAGSPKLSPSDTSTRTKKPKLPKSPRSPASPHPVK